MKAMFEWEEDSKTVSEFDNTVADDEVESAIRELEKLKYNCSGEGL